jgi:hypothetical protein
MKIEPAPKSGELLKFPDETEWIFVGIIDEQGLVISKTESPRLRIVCKICTAKLKDYYPPGTTYAPALPS